MKLKYFALVGLLGFTACDDVIDLKPLDSFTDNSYWTSVNDLRGYANRFYTNLAGPSSRVTTVYRALTTHGYTTNIIWTKQAIGVGVTYVT